MDESTGYALIKLLECRLDNLVYRLGFATSTAAARQMVVHGHILVNGQKGRYSFHTMYLLEM